ncbi:roadblock/LC7 domain-containing protein [Streptomyces sp. NBC_01381]|uniref:roadblock/LC7 domain-containing protein n=1 Tax=Streptomyces sp. NBC_01381 TaxID=2903845 RepID=UPI002259890D|nr:roadblock/LC7 domain-containing protein [Streptomyces sp. NBC_01381]MCX4668417.1 roadblock/LC7 domain-containing protein [Streptomyces sp. NBC_01381]
MTQHETDVSWALRDLTESIQEIRFALVASSDGKAITSYGADDPDDVDGGHLFVVRAGVETYLGVLAKEGLDQGLLGHQMRDLSRRMGELLGTTPRQEEQSG